MHQPEFCFDGDGDIGWVDAELGEGLRITEPLSSPDNPKRCPDELYPQIDEEFAVQAAETIVNKAADRYAVILSSHSAIPGLRECIIDGSVLTLREMAELTKHCTLLIGCSRTIFCNGRRTFIAKSSN